MGGELNLKISNPIKWFDCNIDMLDEDSGWWEANAFTLDAK